LLAFFTLIVAAVFKNMMSATQFEVDEDLPNFFKTISLGQADMIVNEEAHCKNKYCVLVNDPDTV
jgi:hypothetical protein